MEGHKKEYWIAFALLIIGLIFWLLETKMKFTSTATREFRANNPLGVSVSSTYDWEGVDLTYPGQVHLDQNGDPVNPNEVPVPGVDNLKGDHLVVFREMQDGANAAAWLLFDAYFKKGFNTPDLIGTRWSGDKTKGYEHSLYEIMGELGDQPDSEDTVIDYHKDGSYLMAAMCVMENGGPGREIPRDLWVAALPYGSAA